MGALKVRLTEQAAEVLDAFREQMNERVGLELDRDAAASILICSAGDRKPSTVAASASRKGRSKYDRKQVPCACNRPGCDKLVTTPDANGKERRYAQGHHPKATPKKREQREVPCACNCGGTVITPNRWGRNVRYIHGHHGRKKKPAKREETSIVPVERRGPGRGPGIRRDYLQLERERAKREALKKKREELLERARKRREQEATEEPELRVVWSGRQPLTPNLERLPEDTY